MSYAVSGFSRTERTWRAAASVAPTERRDRSTIIGDQGNPMRRCTSTDRVPAATASTYSASWTSRTSSHEIESGISRSAAVRIPSATSRSRSRRYFAIGNRWWSGNGRTKVSE